MDDLTRRRFLTDSARLAAGGMVGGIAGLEWPEVARGDSPPLVLPPPGNLPKAPLVDDQYWQIADLIALLFEELWEPERRKYRPGAGNVDSQVNSALLVTHAIAALTGHQGASRKDDRVVTLSQRFLESPPWTEGGIGQRDSMFHAPGWTNSLSGLSGTMDKSIDPKVAEALMWSWKARDIVQMPPDIARTIEDHIGRCAHGRFFRYPNRRLNQINFNLELYAHSATVTGNADLLRRDYYLHARDFANQIAKPRRKKTVGNLGPSYRFHYQPDSTPTDKQNWDSAEYANLVVQFLMFYEQARKSGMRGLSGKQRSLLRNWVKRVLAGYWTHGGYLNWDTGLGIARWNLGKTWAFALQGLLGIALAGEFRSGAEGAWAKWMLDRGLLLYARLIEETQALPSSSMFKITAHRSTDGSDRLMGARVQAMAARAVVLGLGKMNGQEPPPLYAFDPDIGRLVVTTPSYNTAIVATNQRAFKYGGIDLARLYDADQHVIGGTGAIGNASFGLVVRQGSKAVLRTQQGRTKVPKDPPLTLTRSPQGAVRKQKGRKLHAGPFQNLVATGVHETGSLLARSTYKFRRNSIDANWDLKKKKGKGHYTVEAQFPSWGPQARVEAVLRGGGRVVLGGSPVSLGKVQHFELFGEEGGYSVFPHGSGKGAVARTVRGGSQPTNPRSGPTLVIQIARNAAIKRKSFGARIVPNPALKSGAQQGGAPATP